MQAALKQNATHTGIHRFGMQIGTLPGSRWMVAKGVRIVKSVAVKGVANHRPRQFRDAQLALASVNCPGRRHRLGSTGLRFLPDTKGPTLARSLIPNGYCDNSFRIALIGLFNAD